MKSEFIHRRNLSWVRTTTSRAVILFFSVLLLATAAYGQSVPGFQAPEKPKVKAVRGEVPFQSRMYGHLKLDAKKTKHLGQLSASEQKRKKDEKVLHIGVVRPLATPLDPVSDSALYTVTEGYIRVAGVVSEGAVAVRVQFKDMSLPQGARVFIYSPTNPNEYYGPYEGRGESDGTFWTPAIHGDTAVIEYFTPAKGNSARTPFNVSSIAHIYKDLSVVQAPAASCELDVTADWLNVAKSVGRIDFVTGGFVSACTGTLLNNAANDQKPYFLTVQHCISTQQEAQSAVVYWNYNTGDSPPFGTPQTNGAKLLATGSSSDFSLLFLTGSLPGGLFFSGWDASAFNGTAAGTAIHHPQASRKRISFGTARQPAAGNCQLGDQCLRVDWSSSITEAGSSGSGIWIGNPSDPSGPRLIGSLSGGLSSCSSPPSQMWDIYARFSASYTSIASFLEANTCATSISATIVVNGVVYIGSTSGKLYAVDKNSGTNLWSGSVGAPVNRPDEVGANDPLTGLGAGEGLIVVPASNLVVAYEAATVSTPAIYVEEGTNNAVALDSVTFVRGPFGLSSPHNFSVDKRTRIILLTSALGLTQADLSDPTALVVEASGVNLPVENVGALSINGISSSTSSSDFPITCLPELWT